MDDGIFLGGGEAHGAPQRLLLRYANRHGLIAGATGTGKTVALQVLAEGFSAVGVPVFLPDVKGDLAGLARPGSESFKLHDAFRRRAETIGLADCAYRAAPVTFWDVHGTEGHPIRTTVAEFGPLLLSRLLGLTEAQEGVINIAFRIADDERLPLLDLEDLRALLLHVGENARAIGQRYSNVAAASVGAIQRRLLVLENEAARGSSASRRSTSRTSSAPRDTDASRIPEAPGARPPSPAPHEEAKSRSAPSAEDGGSAASPATAGSGAGSGRRYTPRPRTRTEPGSLGEALGEAALRELRGPTGRRIVRGILGSLFRGR